MFLSSMHSLRHRRCWAMSEFVNNDFVYISHNLKYACTCCSVFTLHIVCSASMVYAMRIMSVILMHYVKTAQLVVKIISLSECLSS